MLSNELSKNLNQTVVIENKPGAAAAIGAGYVASAAPDGYTLLLGNSAVIAMTPQLKKVGYDPEKSFSPIAIYSASYTILAINNNIPVRNIKEFSDLAKKDPGKITCGTSGQGGATHLACAILAYKLGVEIKPIHYKGSGPSINDTIAGIVDVVIDPAAIPVVKNGQLRGLASKGLNDGPYPDLKDIPSTRQAGIPLEFETWYGILAPANTPINIVNKVSEIVKKMVDSPQYSSQLLQMSMYPIYLGPKAFQNRITQDIDRYSDLIRKVNFSAEQ
jgi:tripartite-type tricarboxylate transporter receptor subunit TctC